MKYKNYEGTVETDMETYRCHGRVLFISDVVTYTAGDLKELKKEFEAAVDDYLVTCEAIGKAALGGR